MNKLVASIAVAFLAGMSIAAPSPEEVFLNPRHEAKAGVLWHWMGSNVTREGIVKDLDWFAESGIGVAVIFALADICTPPPTEIYNPPTGKLVAFTPKWWELLKFACEEAEKRGIELGFHQTPGYSSTGGPWIPPRLAMRELVFNVTNAEEQISLKWRGPHPVRDPETEKPGNPNFSCRRTDIQEIAVVDGVRIAHIPMGSYNQPAQWELLGLECDKMNPEAVAFHIDYVLGEIKKHLGGQVGRGLKFLYQDSYEAGKPTWTPRMREEFIARRGYDPLPYLPVLGGFKTKAAPDKVAENKFKTDYERTIKDLYRDVLFKTMHEKINAAGLEFCCEPYGGPIESQECAAHVDRLMMEFWLETKRDFPQQRPLDWNQWKKADGTRHNIIWAEAFPAAPKVANWTETPAQLKASADTQFCRGVNKMLIHTCPLQPWSDEFKPGKTMGRWGTHIGRTQTWAKSAKYFISYLNRCQALLQWGEPAKDNFKFNDKRLAAIAREADGVKVVFVANISGDEVALDVNGTTSWLDPVKGTISDEIPRSLPAHGSGFVVVAGSADVSPAKNQPQAGPPRKATPTLRISATWRVAFGDVEIETPELKDWTKFDDPHIKYFSGTAVYCATFKCDGGAPALPVLSLGDCNGQIARVIVNGYDCGTLWCEPYKTEIPRHVLREDDNELKIEFTNVWANRLIGDEQEPPDCDFAYAPQKPRGYWYLRSFPDWFKGGIASRPSKGRKCFVDWNYFDKDSPLAPSGLIGPVEIDEREK